MTTTEKSLTADRLRELLDYDPDTGVFTWRARTANCVKAGGAAGHLRKNGYIEIRIDNLLHYAHRLAWIYVTGEWPSEQLDHVNCIKDDNRIANLRLVNQAGNTQNQRNPRSDNKTGFLGVSLDRNKRFRAQIQVNGKNKRIGSFATPEEAHAAYLEAKRTLHPFGTL